MSTKLMSMAKRKEIIGLAVEKAFQIYPLTIRLVEGLTKLVNVAKWNDGAFHALAKIAALRVEPEVKSVQSLERQRVEIQFYHAVSTTSYV